MGYISVVWVSILSGLENIFVVKFVSLVPSSFGCFLVVLFLCIMLQVALNPYDFCRNRFCQIFAVRFQKGLCRALVTASCVSSHFSPFFLFFGLQ